MIAAALAANVGLTLWRGHVDEQQTAKLQAIAQQNQENGRRTVALAEDMHRTLAIATDVTSPEAQARSTQTIQEFKDQLQRICAAVHCAPS